MNQTFYPTDVESLSNEEKLKYYSDPDNITLWNYGSERFKDSIDEYREDDFPESVLITQTHATYYVPSDIRHSVTSGMQSILKKISPDGEVVELKNCTKKEVYFLLKNYSDYKTRALLKDTLIPNEQIILHKISRAFGDPNRPHEKNEVIISSDGSKKYIPKSDRADYVLQKWERDWSLEFIREVDFWNIMLFRDVNQHKDKWIQESEQFHGSIERKLIEIEDNIWYSIMIDEHDTEMATWTLNGMESRKEWFPLISLGDLNGISCHPDILKYFRKYFAKHLWIDEESIVVNEPFTWWYTTIKHGMGYRQELERQWKSKNIRNVIQIEYGRFLFNNVLEQRTDFDRAKFIWECRRRALIDVDREVKKGNIDLWF